MTIRAPIIAGAWQATRKGLLALARDRRGNAMPIVAAAVAPLLAMIGGGIDMGRSYLAETRLQQACDAGVLAARKSLGAEEVVTGSVPTGASSIGNRFFNVNFRAGAYGTEQRSFSMTMTESGAIAGRASAAVPTSIMRIFGYQQIPVEVACEAQMSFANTDVMMVLDVTGSMNETNLGDSLPKIEQLRSVVSQFHGRLEGAKRPGARVRYGFVPYSTNVNVGALLEDDWVVDEWTYQSRVVDGTATAAGTYSYYTAASPIGGEIGRSVHSTYAATFAKGKYTCPTLPGGTFTSSWAKQGTRSEPVTTPLAGTRTYETWQVTYNGDSYAAVLSGTTCTVNKTSYKSYILELDYVTEPALVTTSRWDYKPITYDVSNWRSESNGCIEERETYDINNWDNVDLDRALDLNLDLVPTSGDPDTQWRPMYPERIYARAYKWNGTGSFTVGHSKTTDEYFAPFMAGTAACPAPARKLTEMSADEVTTYLDSLEARGSTYHDIGMIWGGRLLSPTGLFADENADLSGSAPTSRNLIFLTDGQTSTMDISYSSYGIEPIDRRRWQPSSSMTLTETVEARFSFVCNEVKKRNISVWVIAFGTELNPIMSECAGPGRSFEARNGDELGEVFVKIASSISDLRITR
jgi:Flp pilus assembly protein TadG